jgi:CRISPR-associated protein Cas5t
MEVLRVTGEGATTSFRYPHFMQGAQPTFEMPPPATLYGHVASALGEWFDPAGVEFAVHFTFTKAAEEVEHTHVLTASSGMLPGTGYPRRMEGAVNPFRRGVLFQPRLVLYLNRPDWEERFRNPRYVVALGRSQDLFTYRRVEKVSLRREDHGYLEHTTTPYSFGRHTGSGIVTLMPKFIDYRQSRRPVFERYLILNRRIHSRDLLRYRDEPPLTFWVDPTSKEHHGDQLIVPFLSWVG